MSNSIEFERSSFGIKAIVKNYWQDNFLELLLEKNIKELELNDGKGWKGRNIDFVRKLPNLKSLILLDLEIESIEAIHSLKNLEKLEVITYSETTIDFSSFPKLIECSIEWKKGCESLFEMYNIQKLFINNYDGKDSQVFLNLLNINELYVLNSSIKDLNGIMVLTKLKSLRLANLKNVSSLDGIENLKQLEVLKVQKCKKISQVYPVFTLPNLKYLLLLDMGDIASIKGIQKLKKLKEFFFYESTNILDGDLSDVPSLINLEKISFQNRKHYSHKREILGKDRTQLN